MITRKALLMVFFSVMVAVLFVGCSSKEQAAGGASSDDKQAQLKVSTEPVTLKIFLNQPLDDKEFQVMIADPVKKKYPHITVEPMRKGTGSNLSDLLASGNLPDMMSAANLAIPSYKNLDFLYDITPLTKKLNIDINRFEPVIINSIKIASDKGELYGLPYTTQFNALYYNKDIFDRFGVPYPSDGMTWEDAIEVAKKLTKTDGGSQYRGLDYEQIHRLAYPLSADIINAKTGLANVNNDTWRKIFDVGYKINAISGNKPAKIDSGSQDAFFKDKNLAMYATYNRFSLAQEAINSGLKLGIAQYPSYKEAPNTYGMVDTHAMLIFKSSKYKDQSMQVIDVLTSDEVQLAAARTLARQSPLKNPEMKTQFAADMSYLKGVNMQSIFKSQPAPAPLLTEYFDDGKKLVSEQYVQYVDGKKDLNTALRDADEAVNKMVKQQKAK